MGVLMEPLIIPIDPATLPSAQHKGISRTGHVYTKPAVVRAVRAIVCLLREEHAKRIEKLKGDYQALQRLQDGKKGKPWAVAIEYVYCLNSTPRRKWGAAKATRPDLDNLTKLVLDAIMLSGVAFVDDGQVADMHLTKRHAEAGEKAHIGIHLGVLDDTDKV